jgi:hypothetical protein
MRNARLLCALAGVAALGCDKTVDGVSPVGGEITSPAEVERFVRRAHLDLTGSTAEVAFVDEARDRILAAGNSAAVRGEVVDDLLADPAFAEAFVDEVENRTFAADGYEPGFNLLCGINRMNDPACADCQASADPCSGCTCASITALLAERDALDAAAADLDGGDATTSEVERRFAEATPYVALAGPDAGANNLFEDFLNRAAEPDELQNARAMILSVGVDQSNPAAAQHAGLLFHRLGGTIDDLLDIIFESEIYREAAVNRVFERFIGRVATAAELDHFAATLDPDNPDIREVTRAVLSSREYFGQ